MEEIRIKIRGKIPYYIVMDVIGELLDKSIGEKDTYHDFEYPYNGTLYQVLYYGLKVKTFEIWRLETQ